MCAQGELDLRGGAGVLQEGRGARAQGERRRREEEVVMFGRGGGGGRGRRGEEVVVMSMSVWSCAGGEGRPEAHQRGHMEQGERHGAAVTDENQE